MSARFARMWVWGGGPDGPVDRSTDASMGFARRSIEVLGVGSRCSGPIGWTLSGCATARMYSSSHPPTNPSHPHTPTQKSYNHQANKQASMRRSLLFAASAAVLAALAPVQAIPGGGLLWSSLNTTAPASNGT